MGWDGIGLNIKGVGQHGSGVAWEWGGMRVGRVACVWVVGGRSSIGVIGWGSMGCGRGSMKGAANVTGTT